MSCLGSGSLAERYGRKDWKFMALPREMLSSGLLLCATEEPYISGRYPHWRHGHLGTGCSAGVNPKQHVGLREAAVFELSPCVLSFFVPFSPPLPSSPLPPSGLPSLPSSYPPLFCIQAGPLEFRTSVVEVDSVLQPLTAIASTKVRLHARRGHSIQPASAVICFRMLRKQTMFFESNLSIYARSLLDEAPLAARDPRNCVPPTLRVSATPGKLLLG